MKQNRTYLAPTYLAQLLQRPSPAHLPRRSSSSSASRQRRGVARAREPRPPPASRWRPPFVLIRATTTPRVPSLLSLTRCIPSPSSVSLPRSSPDAPRPPTSTTRATSIPTPSQLGHELRLGSGKLYHDARDAGCPEATPSPPSSSPRPAIAAVRFAAPKTPPSSLTTSSFSL
jgi:hypothetical protein